MSRATLVERVRCVLVSPLLVGYRFSDAQGLIDADVQRWQEVRGRPERGYRGLLRCLSEPTHEFRNLYYHRLRHGNLAGVLAGRLLRCAYGPEPTLFLMTDEIGPGLFIQHGFATIVSARRVGANCWINQQVTIGYNAPPEAEGDAAPILLDGARICAGAQVLGGITIGRDAVVGANAVVLKDVPDGQVAVGIPARTRAPGRLARQRAAEPTASVLEPTVWDRGVCDVATIEATRDGTLDARVYVEDVRAKAAPHT
jgi:serine O-acetyltransferase